MGKRRRVWQAEAQLGEPAFEIGAAAGAGMHGNPGRLVDDQDETVAIKNAICQPPPLALRGPLPPPRAGEG